MPTDTRNKSSVKAELYFRVLGKRFLEDVFSVKFLGFVFSLKWVSFLGLGLSKGVSFRLSHP